VQLNTHLSVPALDSAGCSLWVSCTLVRCCCDCTASSAPTTIITRLDSTGTMFVDCALCIYLFIVFDELRALFKMADGWCLFFGGRSHDLLNLQHSSRTIYAVVCYTCCSLSSDHWVCRSFVCYSNEHISCSRPLFFCRQRKTFLLPWNRLTIFLWCVLGLDPVRSTM